MVANASGTAIQKNHYYPFGMAFAETPLAEQKKQPYKYNNKELDQMHGLNLYDYSARQYEPAIGRFTTVDPLAEEFYNWSPYVYTFNNPLRFTDPTGENPIDEIKKLLSGLSNAIEKLLVGNFNNPPSGLQGADKAIYQMEELKAGANRAGQLGAAVEGITDALTIVHPIGSAIETTAKIATGQEVSVGDIAGSTLEAAGGAIGKVGKAAKIVDKAGEAAKTSGWIKRSVFNSLDPAIQKKAADAIEKGIVAPKGNTGIIKLTAKEAEQTGYQYKVKILGKGGDIRIYGNPMKNGHIYFDKIMRH